MLLEPVIRAGETYALARDMTEEEALQYWLSPAQAVFVAVIDDAIVGTYYLRANQRGGGDHVANCGYVTAHDRQGQGIATAMARHSLKEAKRRGFLAMQFNLVVSTNEHAVSLWRTLGFDIVGTLPRAFRHPRWGLVDAFVMYRVIDPET